MVIINTLHFNRGSKNFKIYDLYINQNLPYNVIATRLNLSVKEVYRIIKWLNNKVKNSSTSAIPVLTGPISLSTTPTQLENNSDKSSSTLIEGDNTLEIDIISKNDPEYSIHFSINKDSEEDDFLHININISDDAQLLLNKICLKKLSKVEYVYRSNTKRDRYKTKGWIYNGMSTDERNVLLDCELIENKKITLKFSTMSDVNYLIDNIKRTFELYIKSVYQLYNFETKIECKIQK